MASATKAKTKRPAPPRSTQPRSTQPTLTGRRSNNGGSKNGESKNGESQRGKGKVAASDDDKPRSDPLGLDIDGEVLEFIEALDRFRKSHGRPFPSWSEVLHVLRELGYRKN